MNDREYYTIIKAKCEKCGVECNHIKVGGCLVHSDLFTDCIYENGKLRWGGSYIGDWQRQESDLICSNCGEKYTHKGENSVSVRMSDRFIEFMKKKHGGLIFDQETTKILENSNRKDLLDKEVET